MTRRLLITLPDLYLRTNDSITNEDELAELNGITVRDIADLITGWVHEFHISIAPGTQICISELCKFGSGRFLWNGTEVISE